MESEGYSLTDTLDVGLYMCLQPMCGLCCTCVYSVAYPVCLCKPAPVLEGGRESVNAVHHLLAFFSPLFLEPGALMFQHADVGKRPAAPVVVPVSLALPLQSPSAAARRRHAAAGTGAARAPVFKHADLQLRTRRMSRVITMGRVLKYRVEKVLEAKRLSKSTSFCTAHTTFFIPECCHVNVGVHNLNS